MAGDTYNFDAYKGDGMQGMGEFLNGVANAYLQIDTVTKFVEDHLSAAQRAEVDAWVKAALDRFTSEEFAKSQAIADARYFYDDIFREHREKNLPQIWNNQCRSGLYLDTTSQLLANDAYSRTVDKAGAATIETVIKYADVEISRSNPVNQGFATRLQDHKATEENRKEERSPQLGEFLTDAAIMLAVQSLLSVFSNRKYFAET